MSELPEISEDKILKRDNLKLRNENAELRSQIVYLELLAEAFRDQRDQLKETVTEPAQSTKG